MVFGLHRSWQVSLVQEIRTLYHQGECNYAITGHICTITDSKQPWDFFTHVFASSTISKRMFLRISPQQVTKVSSEFIHTYLLKLKGIVDKLATIASPVSNGESTQIAIMGLG